MNALAEQKGLPRANRAIKGGYADGVDWWNARFTDTHLILEVDYRLSRVTQARDDAYKSERRIGEILGVLPTIAKDILYAPDEEVRQTLTKKQGLLTDEKAHLLGVVADATVIIAAHQHDEWEFLLSECS